MPKSPKKKASKKSDRPKVQMKKSARPQAQKGKSGNKIAGTTKKQPPKKKSPVVVKAAAKTEKPVKSNGALEAYHEGPPVITGNNKPKKLDAFTREQKEKLLQLRDAMVDSMAGVAKDNLRSRAEGSEASAFGMHQADAGSDAYDRDFALSLLSQEQDALYEIDQALKRIELGTYGICEMSGKPISHARLEAIPFARFTVECQSQLEKQNKASRVRQSVTSLFGLTDEEGTESEEEEVKTDESKE
jgi:DnaK suppressor protein